MVGVRHEKTAPYAAGDVLDVIVGEPVHGGWCVARPGAPEAAAQPGGPGNPGQAGRGPVLFIRHTLPGERVKAVITQTTAKFARADAVEIIQAAPGRVSAPCPYARPGGCGGCDWQHASPPVQREIKAQVISQQLRRIAGLERAVTVEALPGDAGGLGWRTRVRFAVGKDGRAGLYRHRSHQIVRVSDCLIAHRLVTEAGVTRASWPGAPWVDVAVAPAAGDRAVMVPGRHGTPRFLTQRAAGRDWRVSATGFWQVHPGAADALAEAVLASLRPEPGEIALDLFCGAGLFAGVLASAVGQEGMVIAVEQDATAADDARYNLRWAPWAQVHRGDAAAVLPRIGLSGASIAVLDPPRTGVHRDLIGALCAPPGADGPPAGGSGWSPRASTALRRIGYVSCDPATLARDVAVFGRHGWRLEDLRAFDAFPMTHHVECLALLVPQAR
jgi:tRNA/tmRNA/rRNA uracil-C5-methylase (TrmA/RlmC/RlmD family)